MNSCGKIRYSTWTAADKAARSPRAFEAVTQAEDRRVKALPYACHKCKGWHVGHRKIKLSPA